MTTKTFNRDLKRFPKGHYNAQFIKLIPCYSGEFRLKFLLWNPDANNGKGDTENYATFKKYTKANITKELFKGKTEEEMRNTQWKVHLVKNINNDDMTISAIEPHKWVYDDKWVSYHENWQGCSNKDTQLSPTKEKYLAERRLKDPKFARTEELRNLQLRAIRGEIPNDKMIKVFGIDHDGLINHLKSTIKDKSIKWDKRNSYHIDHIIPISKFNVLDPVEAKGAIHYTNLQVITPKQNLDKYCNDTTTESLSYIEQVLG